MKKILLLITLAFLASGCHTLFVYDTPAGYVKYKNHVVIVDPYYPYTYDYYYSHYYWYPYTNYYYHYNSHKNYYAPPKHNDNKPEVKYRQERTKERTDTRNNSGTRNQNNRKR